MKKTTSSKWLFLAGVLVLLAVTLSCQLLSSNPAAQSNPTPAQAPAASAGQEEGERPGGGFTLEDPTTGLGALNSYRQQYKNELEGTYKGAAYKTSSALDRTVSGETAMSKVESTGPDGKITSLLSFKMEDGYLYTQQKASQSCRAKEPGDAEAANLDPIHKLPPVFNIQEAGHEMLNGIDAVHYTFDQQALHRQAGTVGKGAGELWVAGDDGYVLKYSLKLEITGGDFQGTSTWTYELSDVDKETTITLPASCQPVLVDIPALPDAENLVRDAGFLRYTSATSVKDAVDFYKEKLAADGWTLLPGLEPEDKSALLTFSKALGEGGRLALAQIGLKDGKTQVVIQHAVTKTEAKMVDASPLTETEETPEAPTGQATLPEGLPIYPNGKMMMQNDQAMMFQTADGPEKIIEFYKKAMEDAGWKLEKDFSSGGTTSQIWAKGGVKVVVMAMKQGSQTQGVVSVQ